MLTIGAWIVLALVHSISAVALLRPSFITTMYGTIAIFDVAALPFLGIVAWNAFSP